MIKKIMHPFTKKFTSSVLMSIIFFVGLFLTMNDYNIMWDARNHFFRGQAFANFFLTGRHNYKDLPITKEFVRYYRDYASSFTPNLDIQKRLSKDPNYRRSIYQDEVHTFDWLMNVQATGHPVFSDIGSSFFNILFYEKLGILSDDQAYNLFSIVLASILIGIVFYWMILTLGFFPGVVTTLTLATTPLFWAESHYNIKDIPLLVFFSLAIYAFWRGVTFISKRWIIFSSLLAGCALGTKFNALFIPFIIIPWFVVYYFRTGKKERLAYRRWWWFVFLYPAIMFGVLFVSWPQLWNSPIESFLNVVSYYKSVGMNIDYTPAFRTVFGFSTYASFWIFVTTYPFVLLLSIIGVVGWIVQVRKTKDVTPLLFFLWFSVAVLRASLPNTSIFGGVRHIIEYIPALSLLAGYGVNELVKLFNSYIAERFRRFHLLEIGVIFLFIPFLITLLRLHPAENAYFNSFIGGLPGAKKANLTGWGNTDGGIYKKALIWLNEHAEKNAHIAVGFSETADFYLPEFREDLLADNQFSGYLQKGEYIVAFTHNSELEHTYRMLYPERFLEPLYEYRVEGVPLIKIWKNDKYHLKNGASQLRGENISLKAERKGGELYWDLGSVKRIYNIEINYEENSSCGKLSLGYFQISENNKTWIILPETYPGGTINILGEQPNNGTLIAPFAGYDARFISFTGEPENSCILNVKNSLIEIIEKAI